MKYLNILICFLFFVVSCSKDKCPDGYTCHEDTCICPEGSFEAYGVCRPLESNEFYGVTDERCPCQDSIILHVTLWDDDKIACNVYRGTELSISNTFPQPIRNDTIFPEYSNGTPFGTSCIGEFPFGQWIPQKGYGLISPNRDTIKFIFTMVELTSNWENPDTCRIVFHK